MIIDRDDDPSEILTRLAKDTEQLALSERDSFSPVLKRWHPFPGAVAVVTLHSCFGIVLKQYLAKATCLTNELVRVLHAAGRLEKALVQMVVEDVADSDGGGKAVVTEVVFKPLDAEVMAAYHEVCDPLDKAGGYGIQDGTDLILERITGSFSNVMGLPMEELTPRLRRVLAAD